MTKRKGKKNTNDKSLKISVEMTGLIFILIGIIGLGVFGPVGDLIKKFAIFLFGSYFNVLIALIFLLGLYMLLKRKLPNFFSARLVGFYLLLFAGLSLAHMNYVETGTKLGDVVSHSSDVFLTVISEKYVGLSQTGGGIIGLFGSWAFVSLLDKIGSYIILTVVALFGFFLLLNISFTDLLDKIQNLGSKIKNRQNVKSKKMMMKRKKKKVMENLSYVQ